jgi:hypothetical protein
MFNLNGPVNFSFLFFSFLLFFFFLVNTFCDLFTIDLAYLYMSMSKKKKKHVSPLEPIVLCVSLSCGDARREKKRKKSFLKKVYYLNQGN